MRFTNGQMKMALASQLEPMMGATSAFACAMDCVDARRVTDRWREVLPAEVADAIDGDLAGPKTWVKPEQELLL